MDCPARLLNTRPLRRSEPPILAEEAYREMPLGVLQNGLILSLQTREAGGGTRI